MDIVAHTLVGCCGRTVIHRRRPLSRGTVAGHAGAGGVARCDPSLPLAGWWLFGDGSFAALRAYAVAVPGQEPVLPPLVGLLSHHLHCVMHSAPIAGLVTFALWAVRRTLWIPLLGWWSHIVIDVFTHSADYYPVPVLYPFTQRGFDGIAWITPWFMALNYAALAAVGNLAPDGAGSG
jgi:hypothetical protein